MIYKAFYIRKDGAHCQRRVDEADAMRMLESGAFNSRQVRIEDDDRNVYGIRQRADDAGFYDIDRRVKWLWWWDDDGCLPLEDLE
jgi:hypothetical protein